MEKFTKINQNISPLKVSPKLNPTKLPNALSKDKIKFSNTMQKKKIILSGKDINSTTANHSFLGRSIKEDTSPIR